MGLTVGRNPVLGFLGSALLTNACVSGYNGAEKNIVMLIGDLVALFFIAIKHDRILDIVNLTLGFRLGAIVSSDKSDKSNNMGLVSGIQAISGLVMVGFFLCNP